MREFMVSHTGLEPNYVVEFEYEIKDLKPHQTFLFEQMGGGFHILKKRVVINGEYLNEFYSDSVIKKGNTFLVSDFKPSKSATYFSSNADVPYVCFVLKNGSDIIKTGFIENKHDNLNKVLKLLHLTNTSLKVQVVETLRDLCNNKLVTVHLDLPKTGYKRRSLESVVKSGYATDFEKACLISIVLSKFNIENNPFILSDEFMPVLYKPAFGITVNLNKNKELLFPERVSFWGQKVTFLFGGSGSYDKTAQVCASLELLENSDGKFTGKLFLEGLNLSAKLQGSAGVILDGIKLINEKKTLTSKNYQIVNADVLFVPDKPYVTVNNKLLNYLHLNHLFNSITSSDFVNVKDRVVFRLNTKIHFNKSVSCVFAKNRNIENSAGSCRWQWNAKENILKLNVSFILNKNFVSGNEVGLVQEILAPLFSLNNKVVFINKN
jgi:hypothetical protein